MSAKEEKPANKTASWDSAFAVRRGLGMHAAQSRSQSLSDAGIEKIGSSAELQEIDL